MPPAIIAAGVGLAGGIGGSLVSSGASKSAANTAAAQQAAANQAAIAQQNLQYQTTRGDLAPWRGAGSEASGAQGNLLGLNGGAAQQTAIQQLQASPLYQSLFNTGKNTLLANASATGGLRTGNTNDALAQFGENTLASTIQNQLTNLGGVSSLGENAAALTGQAGSGAANNISALLSGSGTSAANASLIGGLANAGATNSIASSVNNFANSPALAALFGGGNGASINGVSGAQFAGGLGNELQGATVAGGLPFVF